MLCAGSERIEKSEVSGQQLKEAVAINKSLSALGDVISALQRRTPHIPFRNSKLTQVLQDSLCGSSKVLLVCNLSPEAASASESISSLNFASRAAQVELGMARKAAAVAASPQAGASDADAGSSLRAEGSNSSIGSAAAGGTRIPTAPGSPDRKSVVVGRPASRLSERLGGSSSPAPPGSPGAAQRLVMAKPARH
jgi:kinesin family protein C2/C3